jgi:hypothetical protein
MRGRSGRLVAAALMAAGLAVVPLSGAPSSADPPIPTLRLFSVTHDATVVRYPHEPFIYLPLGVYTATVDGAFELDATRTATGRVDVVQVRRDGSDVIPLRTMPRIQGTRFETGLARFYNVRWTGVSNNSVALRTQAFCPSAYDQVRVDDSGPLQPTYPYYCGGSVQTLGSVWGIDAGWAASALGYGVRDPGVADGVYDVAISIARPYADALGIAPEDNLAEFTVTLKTRKPRCGPRGCVAGVRTVDQPRLEPASSADITAEPGPLPDLEARPAWRIRTYHRARTDTDLLTFSATVWNGGEGPLLVEGFRPGDPQFMPATQYFVGPGGVEGKEEVGTFQFHNAPGHHHWHFDDFANYSLYDPATDTTILSGKRSFCLAPTDPVDLTAPGAEWQPDGIGLYSACGGPEAVWLREVLPAGWGDTYTQSVAGQAFDITDLPNGTYKVRVSANPAHKLIETDYDNNDSSVTIHLGGTKGARTVRIG